MLAFVELLKDPYERKARVMPGLLVVLPILVPLVSVYGPKHVVLTGVLGLLAGCGAIHALSNIARGLGQGVQERLVKRWGGLPTTLALRHRNTHFDRVTKARYHAAIGAKLGITMPNEAQEARDPADADQVYIGATTQLREATRKDKALVLNENIAYGFHRNMLAMKPIGLLTSLVGIVYGLLISKVISVEPMTFTPLRFVDPGLPGGLTLLVSVALALAWIGYFTPRSVLRVGYAYAGRLFEALETLPTSRAHRTKRVADA